MVAQRYVCPARGMLYASFSRGVFISCPTTAVPVIYRRVYMAQRVQLNGQVVYSIPFSPGKCLSVHCVFSSSKDDFMPTGSIRQRISLYTNVVRRDAGAAKNINYTLVPMTATGEIELVQSSVYFGDNVRVVVQSLFF